jgi:hypothetical protein
MSEGQGLFDLEGISLEIIIFKFEDIPFKNNCSSLKTIHLKIAKLKPLIAKEPAKFEHLTLKFRVIDI